MWTLLDYTVRPLEEKDLPEMLTLCLGNPLYYEHMGTVPTKENLRRDMTNLPRGRTMEDKFFLGFFRDGRLCAVLDLILRYPGEDAAFVGWFILRADLQGRGEGTRIVETLLDGLREKVSRVRLGRVKGNPQSRRFWEKNGFLPVGLELPQEEGYTVVVMEKPL